MAEKGGGQKQCLLLPNSGIPTSLVLRPSSPSSLTQLPGWNRISLWVIRRTGGRDTLSNPRLVCQEDDILGMGRPGRGKKRPEQQSQPRHSEELILIKEILCMTLHVFPRFVATTLKEEAGGCCRMLASSSESPAADLVSPGLAQ